MTRLMKTKRIDALDALRGFAILTMVLSGVVPYGVLPAWMYHAQVPPPSHQFNPNLPGFTWVDLVFPLFLFALGAAIPVALGKKLEKGNSIHAILFKILERGFLLGFFAIFLRHVRPHVINPQPQTLHWIIAMIGFAMMFFIFTRLPQKWNKYVKITIRAAGWIGAIILLMLLKYPDDKGFSLFRSDIIIIVLTNMVIFGSIIWLFTRDNILIRLGIMGLLIAFRLSHSVPGWNQIVWDITPAPWIYKFYYLQYLFIVLPATIIGDLIRKYFYAHNSDQITITQSSLNVIKTEPRSRPDNHDSLSESNTSWSTFTYILIIILCFALLIGLLFGLQERYVIQVTVFSLFICSLIYYLVEKPLNLSEHLIKKLISWGIFWLILGLVFEPYEGGIKKDHPTMSYYFITTGLSIHILVAFYILSDRLKKDKWIRLFVENGKNPMIAYVGFANFIWPILALTGLEKLILQWTASPWIGFIRGLVYTIVLAFLVRFFTRKNLYWRT